MNRHSQVESGDGQTENFDARCRYFCCCCCCYSMLTSCLTLSMCVTCVCVCVCMCLGHCAILRNESDNKDNIFVIEKFTARLHMREFFLFSPVTVLVLLVLVVVVGLARILAGGRTATPQPPKVCYVTERSIAEKKKKERKKSKRKRTRTRKTIPKNTRWQNGSQFSHKERPKNDSPQPHKGCTIPVVFVLKKFSK